MTDNDRGALILWFMRLRKRELAEQLWSARESLAIASRRACDLAEENRQLRTDPDSTCHYEPDESETERLRAELRRLQVLLLWLRGDLTALEARESLGLPKGTVNSALHEVLAEARKALGLEGGSGQ